MLEIISPENDYSLYIHVPFCTTKCSYCAFYSEVSQKTGDNSTLYGEKLIAELRAVVDRLGTPFTSVHIGGGNPGLLSIEQLTTILDVVSQFGPSAEITIEMNPETLSLEHGILFEHGLNRLSIGIQSMQARHLATLGRNTSVDMNRKAAHVITSFRKDHRFRLNCDLMTCIPGQSIPDALTDIDDVLSIFQPDHISLYNLTIEEGTPLARNVGAGRLQVMDKDGQAQMLQSCWNHLHANGFEHYEISNFSVDRAHRSHHNERYWRLEDYIGLGAGAAGTVSMYDGTAIRTTGIANLHRYIDQPSFSTYDFEPLSKHELMIELLLVGLRTADGIDRHRWHHWFSADFPEGMIRMVEDIEQRIGGLFILDEHHLALTEKGFMVLDSLVYQLSETLEHTPT